jgi:hypothetical protein
MLKEADIVEALSVLVNDYWKEKASPYLLSFVEPALTERGINYKEMLGDERLKAFVKRTKGKTTYDVVEHPSQRAKVGLIPPDATFSYPSVEAEMVAPTRRVSEGELLLLNFLRSVAKLPDDDLNAINIPLRVFVKLVEK